MLGYGLVVVFYLLHKGWRKIVIVGHGEGDECNSLKSLAIICNPFCQRILLLKRNPAWIYEYFPVKGSSFG